MNTRQNNHTATQTVIKKNNAINSVESNGQQSLINDPRAGAIEIVLEGEKPSDINYGRPNFVEETEPTGKVGEPKVEPIEDTPEKTPEKHECKVNMQEAFKQNLVGFIAMSIALFCLGYLFGKD